MKEFKVVNRILTGNRGLTDKEITELHWTLPKTYNDYTDAQFQIEKELYLRGMINSCYIYGENILETQYIKEYYDVLGRKLTQAIVKAQTRFLEKGKIDKDVYTDGEGVSYNSFTEGKIIYPSKEIAEEIANFYADFDPYEFKDCYNDFEDLLEEIEHTDIDILIENLGDIFLRNISLDKETISTLLKIVNKLYEERFFK